LSAADTEVPKAMGESSNQHNMVDVKDRAVDPGVHLERRTDAALAASAAVAADLRH